MMEPDFSNLGAMLQQLGAMLQRAESLPAGAVDWESAHHAARALIAQSPDPSVVDAEHERVRSAAALAQLWLDAATDLPAPSLHAYAWSRSEWLEATFAGWRAVLEPIAQSMQRSIEETATAQPLPEELSAMLAPMRAMLGRLSSVMVAQQLGQAVGTLAGEAWSASDIGIPLTTPGPTALVTHNTRAFAESLEIDPRDFETYLALRDAAAQRLFLAAPWVAVRIRDAIGEFARDVRVDADRLQDLMADIDMSDPTALQEAMHRGGLELPMTASQQAALSRVEMLLALIEGWIETVVEHAHAGRLGSAGPMSEALRRRRATGGPSEHAFTQIMGLALRPRRLREAAAFWAKQPRPSRDTLWQHPEFLPDDFAAL